MRHGNDHKNYRSLTYHSIAIELDDRELDDLGELQRAYDQIYANYMEGNIIRTLRSRKCKRAREYGNEAWDNLGFYFLDDRVVENMSKTMLIDHLEFGESMMVHMKKYVQHHLERFDTIEKIRWSLYDHKLWRIYNLKYPYMHIRSTYDIESQVFGNGHIRLPGYGKLKLDPKGIRDFPVGNRIYNARVYLWWDKERKRHGGANLSIASFPANRDDDGFVVLDRYMSVDGSLRVLMNLGGGQ